MKYLTGAEFAPALNARGDDFKFPNVYFYFHANSLLHYHGGPTWEKWNVTVRDFLIKKQDQGTTANKSHQKGSWGCENDAWPQLGRLGYTAMAILTLEVYYRDLPLEIPAKKQEEKGKAPATEKNSTAP